MRLSVASIGGGIGSASAGKAARRRAVYSPTGSTTQPSAAEPVFCDWPATSAKITMSARQRTLVTIGETPGIAIGPVERVDRAASGLDRSVHEENMLTGFMDFLLKRLRTELWKAFGLGCLYLFRG